MSTDAIRKSRARQKRKDAGLTEVRVWLDSRLLGQVDDYAKEMGVSRQAALIEFVRFCP